MNGGNYNDLEVQIEPVIILSWAEKGCQYNLKSQQNKRLNNNGQKKKKKHFFQVQKLIKRLFFLCDR